MKDGKWKQRENRALNDKYHVCETRTKSAEYTFTKEMSADVSMEKDRHSVGMQQK